ncbi:MAG: MATE family efflux transporter, partial [Acutalibacteraceae bacterium]
MLKLRDGRSVYRALFTLAIPISLQNLITFAVGFADNLMVGTLRNTAISAVYMGTQVQTFLTMMINGLSGAMLILIAQYWGKRDLT